MTKKVKAKNPDGSQYNFSEVGNIKINKWGNEMCGLMIDRLEPVIARAKAEGKQWINLSVFEEKQEQPQKEPAQSFEQVDDEIPF